MEKEEKSMNNSECRECYCPYCDNKAAMSYPFCNSCGKEFGYCPHCNQPIGFEVATCPHCGQKIDKLKESSD